MDCLPGEWRHPKKSRDLLRERGMWLVNASFPISRMCRVFGVSQSGFFAWQDRPACRRQQQGMVYLAHIRTAFALSNGTYGSPRMQRDLVDEGHEIGRHCTARLMRENQLIARQKRRFKLTTGSEHSGPVAPNLIAQDFTADCPDQKWGRTSPTSGRQKAGFTSRSCWISSPGASSVGPRVIA